MCARLCVCVCACVCVCVCVCVCADACACVCVCACVHMDNTLACPYIDRLCTATCKVRVVRSFICSSLQSLLHLPLWAVQKLELPLSLACPQPVQQVAKYYIMCLIMCVLL